MESHEKHCILRLRHDSRPGSRYKQTTFRTSSAAAHIGALIVSLSWSAIGEQDPRNIACPALEDIRITAYNQSLNCPLQYLCICRYAIAGTAN
ncbi:hypothetical protein V1504DRAFT_460402 [Lipomyces starkeyi]